MRVGIVQSSYIPWVGYFDLISRVDHFVLLDDVQYTRRDWRNRNYIKTGGFEGYCRLTVPVQRGARSKLIRDVETSEPEWGPRHWKTISQAYAHAPYFEAYRGVFEPIYFSGLTNLSQINRKLIEACCGVLGIRTPITWSWEHPHRSGKNERLIDICKDLKATHYLTGPKATGYLRPSLWDGITIEVMEYSYPQYPQQHGAFIADLSILDVIFNVGAMPCAR